MKSKKIKRRKRTQRSWCFYVSRPSLLLLPFPSLSGRSWCMVIWWWVQNLLLEKYKIRYKLGRTYLGPLSLWFFPFLVVITVFLLRQLLVVPLSLSLHNIVISNKIKIKIRKRGKKSARAYMTGLLQYWCWYVHCHCCHPLSMSSTSHCHLKANKILLCSKTSRNWLVRQI